MEPTPVQTEHLDRLAKIREAVQALNLAPMGAKLLLAEEPRTEEKFRGLIHLPEVHAEKSKRGRLCRVICAGPEATMHDGALVVIGTYQGTIIDFGPEVSALLVDESELLLGEAPAPADEGGVDIRALSRQAIVDEVSTNPSPRVP